MKPRRTISDEVWAMPGRELLSSLEGLGSMLRIFRRNTDELLTWLARTDDIRTAALVWNANERRALDDHLDEASRLFFNFAASAAARVDHFRVVKRRGHLVGELEQAYEGRVALFAESGLHRLIIGARRYMVHHRLPVAFGQMGFTRSEDGSRFDHRAAVLIATEHLLSDRRSFDSVARDWINGRADVDLRVVVSEYDEQVREFDDWFGQAFASHHLDACEAFLRARDAAVAESELRRRT
jgi:hypothetical protein